ncbi:MAG: cation transporter [Anaerolineae bacterium]|nr:cation transporter [Anaerolineae bacterium]
MNHNHEHHLHRNQENIKVAFFLNAGFALAELIGGILTNSIAILADALHDLGDSISLAISWQLEKLSEKSGDSRYSYGYKRFSLLSALLSGIILLTGSVFVAIEGIQRLIDPQPSSARGMLIFSLVGMAVNGYAAFRTSRGENMNSRMISWHMIEDLLGWAAVFVVSIVLLIRQINVLDPLLSLVVTVFVLYNVIKNLRTTLKLFLQGVPDSLDVNAIEKEIRALDKVKDVHHTHVWSLDGEQHVLTTHVVLCLDAKKEDIRKVKNKVRDLTDQLNLSHTTIEFEYLDDDCSMSHNGPDHQCMEMEKEKLGHEQQ